MGTEQSCCNKAGISKNEANEELNLSSRSDFEHPHELDSHRKYQILQNQSKKPEEPGIKPSLSKSTYGDPFRTASIKKLSTTLLKARQFLKLMRLSAAEDKKMLELLAKGVKEADHYKLNMIPSNKDRRELQRASSMQELKILKIEVPDAKVPQQEVFSVLGKFLQKTSSEAIDKEQALKTLGLVAKNLHRKNQKTKRSYSAVIPRMKLSHNAFVKESTGKFSDNYKILNSLGAGGYGQVFKVKDKRNGNIRAMKMIARTRYEHKNQGKMLFEYHLLKNIDHPNIIRIFEVFKDKKNFYLVMELCQGSDIMEMINRAPKFTEKMAVSIIKQTLSAIMYCHLNGIVHRDIKSENIVFTEDNITSPVKLLDFGISVKYEKDQKLRDRTGTILYIAPEVIDGSYDEKCDLWSCGVLMYTILSGHPPFNGATREDIMVKIQRTEPSFDSKIWTMISSEGIDLIKKLLIKRPDRRPSCREALCHPWFQKEPEISINTAIYLENMRKFNHNSQITTAVCTYILTQLSSNEDTSTLLQSFKKLDRNNDGKLSRAEIRLGLEEAYPEYDQEKLETLVNDMFVEVDYNQSGNIDYTEYCVSAANKQKLLTKQKLKQAFQTFDTNLDGQISKTEWEQCLNGFKFTNNEWQRFLSKIDGNHDGSISFEEFHKFIISEIEKY